jgi:hypothetical protein
MLRLPESVFNHICQFLKPQEVFVSKRVSTQWNTQVKRNKALEWKKLVQKYHAEIFTTLTEKEYEPFFKGMVQSEHKTISLNDLEFMAIFYINDQHVDTFHWHGSGEYFATERSWVETYLSSKNEIKEIEQELKMKLYIFLKDKLGERIKFRFYDFYVGDLNVSENVFWLDTIDCHPLYICIRNTGQNQTEVEIRSSQNDVLEILSEASVQQFAEHFKLS